MTRRILSTLCLSLLLLAGALSLSSNGHAKSAHEFDLVSIDGVPLPMSQFKGKAVLVVNTASNCGYTQQYEGLQALWRKYRERGLVVLGVPSNDFGGQEPGSAQQIKEFCETTFDVDFPMTDKYAVKGKDAHPLYQWLAKEPGSGGPPRWNFFKYLIDADGKVVGSFSNHVEPDAATLTKAIEKALPRPAAAPSGAKS